MPGRFALEIVAIPQPVVLANGYFMLAEHLQQMEIPMERSVEHFRNEIEMNFASESSAGTPWPELKEATVEKKARDRLDPRILRATGELEAQATSEDAWTIERESSNVVAAFYQDNTEHGAFHITGTVFMDQRDYTAVSDNAMDEMEAEFADWMDEAIASAL